MIDGCGISCELALIWMSLDFTDDQSILVQVMAWCRQATDLCCHMASLGHNELSKTGSSLAFSENQFQTLTSTQHQGMIKHEYLFRFPSYKTMIKSAQKDLNTLSN